jgi:hypothetical protein
VVKTSASCPWSRSELAPMPECKQATPSMVQSSFWEAYTHSASQQISHLFLECEYSQEMTLFLFSAR